MVSNFNLSESMTGDFLNRITNMILTSRINEHSTIKVNSIFIYVSQTIKTMKTPTALIYILSERIQM